MAKSKSAEEFDEILEQLPDFDALAREIARDVTLPPFELKNVTDMVTAAGEKWLIQDLSDYDFISIEREFQGWVTTGPEQEPVDIPYTGTEDWKAVIISPRKPLLPWRDKIIIGDWKTAKGELDTKWDNKYREKMQWKFYSHFSQADVFQYRGINRRCDVRSMTLEVPPKDILREFTERQIRLAYAQAEALKHFPIWTMNMPRACLRFGEQYPCPFRDDCPEGGDPQPVELPMRQTTIEDLLHCPEYARRAHLERLKADELVLELGDEVDPYASYNDATIGSAFHRGIAELYRQAVFLTTGKDLSSDQRYAKTKE